MPCKEKVYLRGAAPRRRLGSGSGFSTVRPGQKRIPGEAAESRGLVLPTEMATPAQERELEAILARFVRRLAIRQTSGLPASAYAKAFGVADRQAADLVRRTKSDPCDSTVSLVIDVLSAMVANPPRIAGPLGTRHTEASEWIFARVNSVKLDEAALSWHRGGGRITHQDIDWLRAAKAAFDLDYHVWRGARKR